MLKNYYTEVGADILGSSSLKGDWVFSAEKRFHMETNVSVAQVAGTASLYKCCPLFPSHGYFYAMEITLIVWNLVPASEMGAPWLF